MPYSAQSGGIFGSSIYPNSRPQIDVGGAIDALTSGATSLIHQAMVRRQAQNEVAFRQQDENRQNQEFAFRQKEADDASTERAQDFALRQESERHRFLEAGGIPESSAAVPVAGTSTLPALNPSPSPIRSAMLGNTPVPGASMVPSTPAPAAPTVTSYTPEAVTTPESVDATKSLGFQKGLALVQARGEVQGELQQQRAAAQQAGRAFMADAATKLAKLRASLKPQSGPIAKQMTGNARETMLEGIAGGLLEQHNGNLQDAVDDLNGTPEGKRLAGEGLTPEHLLSAYGRKQQRDMQQASRLEGGSSMMTPTEATTTVQQTRGLLGGKPAPGDSTSGVQVPKPAPAAKPAPGDAPPPKPAAAPTRRPLNAREMAQAQSDAGFASFLKTKGYTANDWTPKKKPATVGARPDRM